MTYTTGGLIQATDYNKFVQGGATVNHNVANVNTIWGVGFGDKGYGQAGELATVPAANVVTATQWATLIARLNSIQTHQTGSSSSIPSPVAGSVISYAAALQSLVDTIYANRNSVGIQGTDSLAASATHNWSNSTPTTFQIVCTYSFADANQARYFFNAGGSLAIALNSVNSLSNLKGTNWVSFLNTKIASFNLFAKSSGRTGTGGAVTSQQPTVGYWGLTTTDQTLLAITSGSATGAYDSNIVRIKAKTNGVQGANGDNGTLVTVTIEFEDIAVDIGTNRGIGLAVTVNSTARRPETAALPTVIAYPAFSSTSAAGGAGGGGSTSAFNFSEIISTNRSNYNVRSAAVSAGWDQVKPLNASVTVSSGVVLGSISGAVPALVVDSSFTSGTTINLVNNGFIVGRGGSGSASAGATAEAGGPALRVDWPTFITNSGTIGGGGGGGGNGAGTLCDGFVYAVSTRAGGGGGGGGAGSNPGAGGPSNGFASGCSGNIYLSTPGAAGGLTAGGAGGRPDYTHCGPNQYTIGGTGGSGGGLGQRGATGGEGKVTSECCGDAPNLYGWPGLVVGVGGAAGACMTPGSSAKITWIQTGNVLGAFG